MPYDLCTHALPGLIPNAVYDCISRVAELVVEASSVLVPVAAAVPIPAAVDPCLKLRKG